MSIELRPGLLSNFFASATKETAKEIDEYQHAGRHWYNPNSASPESNPDPNHPHEDSKPMNSEK